MDESLEDRLIRRLPQIYKSPQNWQREWEILLAEELGSYLDQIEDSINKFASARPRILEFMAGYERDEMAERLLFQYVEERLSGVPLHLLSENFTPDALFSGEGHTAGNLVDETGSEADANSGRMDRRSVTMAAEKISTAGVQQATVSMAPPPRPSAPVAPMTPATPGTSWWNTNYVQAEAGSSRQQSRKESPVPQLPAVSDNVEKQKAKRPVDSLGPQEQQETLQSRSKKPKTSAAFIIPRQSFKPHRALSMLDVDEMDYLFRDARCGAGWYVIRCYTGKTQTAKLAARFLQHPLRNNLALEHFNQKSPCHTGPRGPPKSKYTEEKILEKFAYRGECARTS